ncbi:MAG: hypothetical protein J3R72DRAFT_132853 [Linnemannia gamsii]|nr:MAG: hypothetical protein J3R72DRAFT_132853 [Linnemannia gamsii]
MPSRQHHSLFLTIFLNLLFFTSSTTAELVCISPPTSTTSLQSGTPFSLRFTNKPTTLGSALLSDVSANLICTSTGDSVLTLAKKLEQGKSVLTTISPAQASSALKLCSANNFHVQYEESSFLSKNSENCAGSFSIQLTPPLAAVPDTAKQPEHPAIALPPISVPLPIPGVPTTATTTGSASAEPTATTIVEPQPTITAPIKPTTTTTIIATTTSTTAAVVPPVVPPNPTSATTTTTAPLKNPPPATTTTHPPKSGGNHNGGGGNGSGINNPESSPTNFSGDISSSDMQQSTGSGPSTASIAGMSIGVIAGIFVILGAMLVWRRRSQRRADFDLFYTDTLAAASGFQQPKNSGLGPRGTGGLGSTTTTASSAEQPIYGRSAPEQDEKYEISGNMNNSNINNNNNNTNSAAPLVTRKLSSNTPRRSRSHTSTHHNHRHPTNNSNRSPIPPSAPPPPMMPMHPYPVAGNGGQDSSFYQPDSYYNNQYHQHQQPDYYQQQQQQQQQHLPQRKPSYKLPRQHPAFDYDDRSYRSQ